MSGSVLFDTPGPRTRARHRIYTAVSAVVLAGLLVWFAVHLNSRGQFAYERWEPFLTPDYLRALLVDGLLKTLQAAFTSIIGAVVFGVVFGVGKLSDHAWVRWPCWAVVEFFRAVPLLLLIVYIFFAYGTGDGIGSYWSLVIGLVLYNGSVLAEVFRAGVLAVPKGQAEAAYALGMRKTQVMMTILLPQAVKVMLPALISQCVVALKDTSLGAYILAPGLSYVAEQVWTEFRVLQIQFQAFLVAAALYIVVNLILTWIATLVQRRLVGERRQLEVSNVTHVDRAPGV